MLMSRRACTRVRLKLQNLEDRLAPATNIWTGAANDGLWATIGNWSLNHAPASTDDVVIGTGAFVTLSSGTNPVHGLDLDATLNITGGSLTLTGQGSISGLLTVSSSATFTVQSGATLEVESGAKVIAQETSSSALRFIVNGSLNVDTAEFFHSGSKETSVIEVNSGGSISAVNSKFDWSNLSLASGSFTSGDLTGNEFNSPIYLPYNQMQYLSGAGSENVHFELINILPGTIPSGQTLALNQIGVGSTANLRYNFPDGITVGFGGTLNVGMDVDVYLPTARILTVNGEANLSEGSTLFLSSDYSGGTQVLVNGNLTLDQATITELGNDYFTSLTVKSGGRLIANSSTFRLTQLTLDNGATFNPGDLEANTFDLALYLPAEKVANLSALRGGSDNHSFRDVNILPGSWFSGTLYFDRIGEDSSNVRFIFPGAFIVQSGAALVVTENVRVLINTGQTLTVGGNMSLASGSELALSSYYSGGTQVIVNGTLTVNHATVTEEGSDYYTSMTVNSNGHLIATSSIFRLSQLTLSNGVVFNPGDLANNTFDLALFLPATKVAYLSALRGGSDNQSFRDVNILSGTWPSGTLYFDAIGANSPNLRFIFPGAFSVANGAALAVAENVRVLINTGQTLTVGGNMLLANGSELALSSYYSGGTQVIVNGTLTVDRATVTEEGSDYYTSMTVNIGGRLIATSSLFRLSQLTLNNGVVFNPGDLADNTFDLELYLPASKVAYLSALRGGSDNKSFRDVNILAGTWTSGTLYLDLIGLNSANLRYVFPGAFTVANGASLEVANVTVLLQTGQVLTVNGNMKLAPASILYLSSNYSGGTQVFINGTLTTDLSRIEELGSDYFTRLTVNNGGRLIAKDTTFRLNSLIFANGSILKPGDLTGNSFIQDITIPVIHAAQLTNNVTFQNVYILAGSLASGQIATLTLLPAITTQQYIIDANTGNLVVQPGAILNIIGGAIVFAVESNSTVFGITVNGTMNVSNALLPRAGTNGSSTLQVGSGGRLTATSSSIGWSNVNLNAGSTDDLEFINFASRLTIHSNATIDFINNSFAAGGADGVLAVGDSGASIDLRNNYWGTTDPVEIGSKIRDHLDDAGRPTILFDPFLNNPPSPYLNPTSLPFARAGASYNQPITASTGAGFETVYSILSGSLPPGLSLSTAGVLSGFPTEVGSFTFRVQADDTAAGGVFTTSQLYWVAVNAPIISITPALLPATMANVGYNQTLTGSGGTAPYDQFLVTAGILPSGMALAADGTLSGTPSTEGNFQFTVTVQDSTTGLAAPYTGSQSFNLIVDSTPPTAGNVNDGPSVDIDYQASGTTIFANWSGFADAASGIASYEWAIGTTPGGTDVQTFTDVGNSLNANASGLSLINGTVYYASVRATDFAGNTSPAAVSDGVFVDTAPPTAGTVNDGLSADIDIQGSTTTISANWNGFSDAGSSIASYRWAIGTTPGATDIRAFSSVGTALSATASGLTLARDTTYYVSVRAVDTVGNVSSSAVSNGVTVVIPSPVIVSFSTDSAVPGDGITSDATPTLFGTAEANATIKIYANSLLQGQVLANGSGNWQFDSASLADGLYEFTATATDSGGSTSVPSDPLAITVDATLPTVTIDQDGSQLDPTNTAPISFAVHFSEPVTGFTADDVVLSGTVGGSLVAGVTGSGADYLVTVTGMSGVGTVVASILAGSATDTAGNLSLASTSTDNSVNFDDVAPTVTINQAVGQPDPTYQSPIVFTVSFSESVSGFTAGDVDLSASTVGGTLVADVSGSGTDYVVTVTGMVGYGTIVVNVPAGVANDAAGNDNLASTSTDNSVFFSDVGSLQFADPVYSTFEGALTVTLMVDRIEGSNGPISVHYSTSDGTAGSADYSATQGDLFWATGDVSPKPIVVTIAGDDALSEGDETFTLTLSSPTDNAGLGTQATATVVIAKSNGITIDASDKKPLAVLTDSDGDLVTLKLKGKLGKMTYYLTDGEGPISVIDLANTDSARSVLVASVKKPKGIVSDGRVQIGEINGTGLKKLALAKADLVGAGIHFTSFLGNLTIGSIENGANITLSGLPPKPRLASKITAGVIGDGTDISISDAPLARLKAISVGVGNISAPSVGSIVVHGKSKTRTTAAIPGDFKSNLDIAGIGLAPRVPALKLLKVKGTVADSFINVGGIAGSNGDVGRVAVGSFVNSRLFAGYAGPDDGSVPFNLPSTVGKFVVTGKTEAFANSFVIASNFRNVLLASVEAENGGNAFGFIYHDVMKSLRVKLPAFNFDRFGAAEQFLPFSDFYVSRK